MGNDKKASATIDTYPPLAFFDDANVKRLHQYCSDRVPLFVHPSQYRALKLTFPWDIDNISPDGTIKRDMGQNSMGPAVSVLILSMFNSNDQL